MVFHSVYNISQYIMNLMCKNSLDIVIVSCFYHGSNDIPLYFPSLLRQSSLGNLFVKRLKIVEICPVLTNELSAIQRCREIPL